jgi:hypothetical protein
MLNWTDFPMKGRAPDRQEFLDLLVAERRRKIAGCDIMTTKQLVSEIRQ